MNHGPAFQALWAKLRADVRRLQSEGYYGDGSHASAFSRERNPDRYVKDSGPREPVSQTSHGWEVTVSIPETSPNSWCCVLLSPSYMRAAHTVGRPCSAVEHKVAPDLHHRSVVAHRPQGRQTARAHRLRENASLVPVSVPKTHLRVPVARLMTTSKTRS